LIEDLVGANRILASENVVDAYGHVTTVDHYSASNQDRASKLPWRSEPKYRISVGTRIEAAAIIVTQIRRTTVSHPTS